MSVYKENACNGCAECIGCGRRYRDFYWVQCDGCGNDVTDVNVMDYKGDHYCLDCFKDRCECNFTDNAFSFRGGIYTESELESIFEQESVPATDILEGEERERQERFDRSRDY